MPDQLATPWSTRPSRPALPVVGGVPALARVPVTVAAAPAGVAAGRAGAVVLVAPWSSYRLPMPAVLPSVDGLPGLVARGPLVPSPRTEGAVPALV